jgi:glycosyltransferase involved in cell wall biosynthesis
MKIVLDVTIINRKDKITGIERVALESVKNILQNKEFRKKHLFFILCSKSGKDIVLEEIAKVTDLKGIKFYKSPIKNRVFTDQVWLPFIIERIDPDYVYYTTLGIPLINRFPFSMVIHDAVAWAMPDTISKGMKYYYKPLIEHAIKSVKLDKVMTVSYFSKKEIIKYLGINDSKIFVNYLGVSPVFLNFCDSKENIKNVLEYYGIFDNFIIALGTLEPRKNISGLIEAYKILKSTYGYKGKLVLVGRRGWIDNFNIDETLSKDIIFTGFVKDEHIPILLKASEAFVFPSFYEGFGLPLIEAMSLGIPVIASNKASLPEIGGDACEYFDPTDHIEMAQKIFYVIENKEKAKSMCEKAKNIAKLFTWEKHANTIINVMFR